LLCHFYDLLSSAIVVVEAAAVIHILVIIEEKTITATNVTFPAASDGGIMTRSQVNEGWVVHL
jgi:hypothetical protein